MRFEMHDITYNIWNRRKQRHATLLLTNNSNRQKSYDYYAISQYRQRKRTKRIAESGWWWMGGGSWVFSAVFSDCITKMALPLCWRHEMLPLPITHLPTCVCHNNWVYRQEITTCYIQWHDVSNCKRFCVHVIMWTWFSLVYINLTTCECT